MHIYLLCVYSLPWFRTNTFIFLKKLWAGLGCTSLKSQLFRKLRQEDQRFKACLSILTRSCLKVKRGLEIRGFAQCAGPLHSVLSNGKQSRMKGDTNWKLTDQSNKLTPTPPPTPLPHLRHQTQHPKTGSPSPSFATRIQFLHMMLSTDKYTFWATASRIPSAHLWHISPENDFSSRWQPFCGGNCQQLQSLWATGTGTLNFGLFGIRFGSESDGHNRLQPCSLWDIPVSFSLWRVTLNTLSQPALVVEAEQVTGSSA